MNERVKKDVVVLSSKENDLWATEAGVSSTSEGIEWIKLNGKPDTLYRVVTIQVEGKVKRETVTKQRVTLVE